MPEARAINFKLTSDLTGLAASVLDSIATELQRAADGCRDQAETLRHVDSMPSTEENP